MRENRQGDARAVVQAGMCTALAVILSMIGLYTPLFSIVTFMLIPLPIAYLGLRQGVRWSVIVTAGVMVLDSVFFGLCQRLQSAPCSAVSAWCWEPVISSVCQQLKRWRRDRLWCWPRFCCSRHCWHGL